MPRPRTASPTQATVARAAGVSVPTVSKALRGDPSISERTRLLVHETAARVGYAPPGPAGGASREASRAQVHVVFDTVDNAYTSQVLAGMLASAREVGSALQVEHLGTPADHLGDEGTVLTEQLVEDVCGRGDALILVTTPVSDRIVRCCEERLVPLLVIDPASDTPQGVITLSATNWRGGVQATTHLLGLGHRRIAVVCGPEHSLPSVERLAGFRSACADARVEVDDALVRPGRYDYASGLEQGRELLRLPEPPTAVLALNDTIAVGVLEAARRHGLRVPEDLSVVGFDDSSIAALSSPLLTTVRQPLHDIGVEAVRIVTQARASGRVGGSPVEMQTSLVVRSSTGPAPYRPRT